MGEWQHAGDLAADLGIQVVRAVAKHLRNDVLPRGR